MAAAPGGASEPPRSPTDIVAQSHVSYLVYPFRGAIPMARGQLDPTVAERWESHLAGLSAEQQSKAVDDSFAYLPHARRALFAEAVEFADRVSGGEWMSETAVASAVTATLAAYRQDRRPVRLRLRRHYLEHFGPRLARAFRVDGSTLEMPVDCGWIDLVCYPSGTALLVIKFSTSGQRLRDIGRMLRSIKRVHYRERLRVRPAEFELPTGEHVRWSDLLPRLLDRFGRAPVDIEHTQTIGASFRAVSCALVDHRDERGPFGNFESSYEGHLFALATGEDVDGTGHPGTSLLGDIRQAGLLRYWESWGALALWDDVANVAVNDEFGRRHLLRNVETLYLPLYLLTVYQQIRLQEISSKLSNSKYATRVRGSINPRIRELEQLTTSLLEFRSRYCFIEVSRAPVIAALYECFQRHFRIDELSRHAEEQLERLRSQARTVSAQALNRLIAVVTFIAVPISVLAGVFGEQLREVITRNGWLAAVAATVLILGMLAVLLIRRR